MEALRQRIRELEAERTPDDREEPYRLAMEATTEGLWDWNVESGSVAYSRTWAQILGEDQVRPDYRVWESRIHPEDRERVVGSLATHLEGRTAVWQAEHRLRTGDGSWRWVVGRGRVTDRDADGKPLRMLGTMTDISEQKRIEGELRDSERRHKLLLEHSGTGIAYWDTDGTLLLLNGMAARHLGGRPEELIGRSMTDIFGEAASVYLQRLQEVRDSAVIRRYEDRLSIAGDERWHITSFAPVADQDGSVLGIQVVAQDVTELKTTEERLRVSLAEKEVLLREIHHRVKNNLAVIASLLSLQAKSSDSDEVREALRESERRVRAIALIHSKLYQSGNLRRIDMADYLQSMTGELLTAFSPAVERITFDLQLEPVELSVDDALPCAQIATEVVTNSLKHAFPGDRTGTIRIVLRQLREGVIELTLADDGVGLPTDVDPNRPTTLGLILVSALARQLEAKLSLDRSNGTSFTMVVEISS